jgi:alginate O-acetyltransferase complex protein AlgI
MLFCSAEFFLFFALIFSAYWAMPWQRLRVWLLLAASLYFYASWNKQLAILIAVSTSIDYLLARAMDAVATRWRRRALLAVSLCGNLGLLCYFKYANFFLASLEQALQAAGATASMPVLRVILPVGISFYTFEAISYTVDVYRRRMPAERNLAHFMLFILFFPHLVAGPIVRARDFLPQVGRKKHWNWMRMTWGVQLFLVGLFKKVVVADWMAAFVKPIFEDPESCRVSAAWLGMFAFAVQIYCDFSGYTDMAIGAAHLLGYKLAPNFRAPYLAGNIQEFWRCWHISLSSWLRDYLFIPLGGSRNGYWQTARNLLVTMTLGGLWHGASWAFVVWGLAHGILLLLHRAWAAIVPCWPGLDRALARPAFRPLAAACTFLLVSLLWVFFRAPDLRSALAYFGRLFALNGGVWHGNASTLRVALLLAVLAAMHIVAQMGNWNRRLADLPGPVRGLGYALILTLALILAPDVGQVFIYFQF